MKVKIAFIIAFLLFPVMVSAQENSEERDAYLEGYLSTLAKEDITVKEEVAEQPVVAQPIVEQATLIPEQRTTMLEKALRNLHIELAMEYIATVQGKQTFEVIDDSGQRISRLSYPHKGEIWLVRGEMRLLPRISVGGRYGNSNFRKSSSTDTDWLPNIAPGLVWNESISDTNIKLELYDINLYCRLLNFDKDAPDESSQVLQMLNNWMADKLSLDVFGGYQKQKARYKTYNLLDTIEDWRAVHTFIPGEASFYKIKYYGPRLGLRAEGSRGKFSSRLSFAYAQLKTNAFGWWNLRNYHFWQSGKNGQGLEFEAELTYKFTPHLSAGIGFNYISLKQKNLSETGIYETDSGNNYKDLDIIRNANCSIYGPSVILKYIW
jgi:hypothetical protein